MLSVTREELERAEGTLGAALAGVSLILLVDDIRRGIRALRSNDDTHIASLDVDNVDEIDENE